MSVLLPIMSLMLLLPCVMVATTGFYAWKDGHKRTAVSAWIASIAMSAYSVYTLAGFRP